MLRQRVEEPAEFGAIRLAALKSELVLETPLLGGERRFQTLLLVVAP